MNDERMNALPTILNPLVNTIFNCPNPFESEFASTFKKIQNEKFILVVPSTEILLFGRKLSPEPVDKAVPYYYTREFIESHILLIAKKEYTKGKQTEYQSLFDPKRSITISNCEIYHDKVRKCRITRAVVFPNFNDYLKGASHFLLLYTDQCLSHNVHMPVKSPTKSILEETPIIKREIARRKPVLSLQQKEQNLEKETVAFELLLEVNQDISENFGKLLLIETQRLKNGIFQDVSLLKKFYFTSIERIISWCYRQPFFNGYVGLDNIVYKYAETVYYEIVMEKLKAIVHYSNLSKLVLPQVYQYLSFNDIPSFQTSERKYSMIDVETIVCLEKNLGKAELLFQKMIASNTCDMKCEYLVGSLTAMSENNCVFDDADSLIGLIIMCICRCKDNEIYAHLLYLRNFITDPNKMEFGSVGYSVSTLEAAIKYLLGQENREHLVWRSEQNKAFWDIVRNGNLKEFQDFFVGESMGNILLARTCEAESVFSVLIENKTHGAEILQYVLLLDSNQSRIHIEDLLQDRDSHNQTLLLKAVKRKNDVFVDVLLESLVSNCSERELEEYFDVTECVTQRTVAHYLGLNSKLVRFYGHYMDWERLDTQRHTPLFVLFRFYDHAEYNELVEQGLKACLLWCRRKSKTFGYMAHTDTKGNTLLHVMQSNIQVLLDNVPNIPTNAKNQAGLSPLMVYSRYSRLDNICQLLEGGDKTYLFEEVTNNQKFIGYTSLDFAKNANVLEVLGAYSVDQKDVVGKVKVLVLKYEKDCWFIYFATKIHDTLEKPHVFKHPLKLFMELTFQFLKQNPETFLPMALITKNNPLEEASKFHDSFFKLELNTLLAQWSDIITAINIMDADFRAKFIPSNADLTEKSITTGGTSGAPDAGKTAICKRELTLTTPEEVSSIKSFLLLSLNEVLNLKRELNIMRKLVGIKMIKFFEISAMKHTLFTLLCDAGMKRMEYESLSRSTVFQNDMLPFTFLLSCIENLIAKIQNVLQRSVSNWWKQYGEYLDIQKKLASIVPYTTALQNTDTSATPSTDDKWVSIFGNYFDGNKQKHKEKLTKDLQLELIQFRQADSELQSDYVVVAQEMSSFMGIKDLFMYSRLIVDTSTREHVKTEYRYSSSSLKES